MLDSTERKYMATQSGQSIKHTATAQPALLAAIQIAFTRMEATSCGP